jgi:hypothetical protein
LNAGDHLRPHAGNRFVLELRLESAMPRRRNASGAFSFGHQRNDHVVAAGKTPNPDGAIGQRFVKRPRVQVAGALVEQDAAKAARPSLPRGS